MKRQVTEHVQIWFAWFEQVGVMEGWEVCDEL